jgi:ribose transport system substrate-binding protein
MRSGQGVIVNRLRLGGLAMKGLLRVRVGILVAAFAAALTAGALSAQAGTHRTAAASKGNLLWVQPLRNHPVHRVMQAGFLDECKKIGYHCEIVGNPSATTVDVPASVALAEAALSSKHFDGVGVYAFSPEMYPFALKVQKQGYPTVSWHILLKQGTKSGIDAITGCDPKAYAVQAAQAMGKKLGGQGKVAVTEGSFNTIENLVAKQFTATMHKEFPNIKVLAPDVEGFEPSAAASKAVSIIQANQDLTGAFSTTGGGPATWANAQRQAGHKLTIIAMDYVRQNLDLVKSGQVYAVVGQPLYQEGAKTADLLAAMAQHKKVPYYNFLPAPVITKAMTPHYYALLARAHQ